MVAAVAATKRGKRGEMSEHGQTARSLAAATCTLLGTATTLPAVAQEEPDWQFDTSLLYYGESDGRVQDASLNVLTKRLFRDDRILSIGLAVDSLTGATPSGAVPLNDVQTFTRPSGDATYTVAPGELPLDDTFLDTRYALTASWQQPIGRLYSGAAGVSFSTEYDYTHVGANFALGRDFNKRNTTVSVGVAVARDDIDPVGGAPLPLSLMSDVGDLSGRGGPGSKDVIDLLFGVSQVINEKFVVQVNYSLSDASGYLNDPYKILSVVDPVTGETVPRQRADAANGPLHEYRFESRPDQRTKHSFFAQGKYYAGGNVLDASYRFMTDDWGIDSHTLEGKLYWPLGDSRYLEPHLRFYTQGEADFYRVSLPDDGAPLPQFASADNRLGAFDAVTAGLKYGWRTDRGHDLSLRLEYYRQDGDVPADQLIGSQDTSALNPGLDAVIFNFSYGFGL